MSETDLLTTGVLTLVVCIAVIIVSSYQFGKRGSGSDLGILCFGVVGCILATVLIGSA